MICDISDISHISKAGVDKSITKAIVKRRFEKCVASKNACTDQKNQDFILRKPHIDDAQKLIEYMKLVDSETKIFSSRTR